MTPRLPSLRPFPGAAAVAVATAARTLFAGRTGRCVLRPLDQLLRCHELAVLVLRDELEADPATLLVDFLHEDVDDVAAVHDVLDVSDATRADVRHVQQAVRALLELDERTEVGR